MRLVQPPSPPDAVYNLHPQRIGRPGRLRVLERLLALMQGKPGTRFLRCGDLARWCLNALR